MRKLLMILLLIMVMTACSYLPPWWGSGDEEPPSALPPGLPPQPTLIYPSLPWNHPCNDPAVPQLPGACP